jgi:hypothetical protein
MISFRMVLCALFLTPAALNAQTVIGNGTTSVTVHESGVILGVPEGGLLTTDGPRVLVEPGTAEWFGFAFDSPDGHVSAVASGLAADWARRTPVELVSFTATDSTALSVTRAGDMLIFATDNRLLTGALDRWLDGADSAAGAAHDGLASFAFDTSLLRPADIASLKAPTRRLLGKRLATPLANLLFGGLTLGEGMVHGTLSGIGTEVALDVCLPPVPDDAPQAWFPAPTGGSLAMPVTPETLAVLTLRRDLGDWWRNRETYMPDGAQPALAKADQNMALIFAGQSPAEDVFGQASTEMALIVDRQRFESEPATPDVRLPAFCLVTRLRDPEAFTPTLAVAFQTLLGVINTDRAQNTQAPFLLDTEMHEGVGVRAGHLLAGAGSGGMGEPAAIDFNFSPAVAVVDGWALIGTSAEQVRRLVSALHAGETNEGRGDISARIDVARVMKGLEDNRGALVAQAMLEDGLGPEEAMANIDHLFTWVSNLRSVDSALTRQAECLHMDLDLLLSEAAP